MAKVKKGGRALKGYSPDILISGSPDLLLLVKESIIGDQNILLRMI